MSAEILSEQTVEKRPCVTCGAANLTMAKFCGSCGSLLDVSKSKTAKRSRRSILFRGAMILAALILVGSAVMSYQLFNSTESVKVSAMPFTDIAIDHPVYRVCKNLLDARAIGYRKILEFAPHATISAAEWNYAVKAVARKMQISVPSNACFPENAEVDAEGLRDRLLALNHNVENLNDASRIKAYFQLEQATFFGRMF